MTHSIHPVIKLTNGVTRSDAVRFRLPINFSLNRNEHLAIVGLNGSGKSILIDTILGKYPLKEGELTYDFFPSSSQKIYENIKYITFRDSYGEYDSNYYYQQRWNSTGQEELPEVKTFLEDIEEDSFKKELIDAFQLKPLLDKKIVLLSSGELRKFQLLKALFSNPRVLIIDNPFIGLDASARKILDELLCQLAKRDSLQIILLVSTVETIPAFVTHVIPVCNRICKEKLSREYYINSNLISAKETNWVSGKKNNIQFPEPSTCPVLSGTEIIRMSDVTIRYGDRTILKDLNWVVKAGEKWALSGKNGSGKSTLLSLIYADNPQSYACNISLFGRKRGTGESIWEIKRNIGYVSPEMHRAYLKNIPAIEIVGSGLFDSIGLYKKLPLEKIEVCEWWMKLFEIEHLKNQSFLQLSSGEQRLCLLARAFVKNPALLILDEPLHGLDDYNRQMVKNVIDSFCKQSNKTLIMVTHYEEELPSCIQKKKVL